MRIAPLSLLLTLAACQPAADMDYANKGDPERQLVVTQEAYPIELDGPQALIRLKEALKTEPPQRATADCDPADGLCAKAKSLIMKSGIPLEISGSGNNVTLHYRHIAAMDCDQRYRDNSRNNANIAMPQLGCSLRANMVQMVTDKQQFINPGLLDYQDGEKAAQTYQRYLEPPAQVAPANAGASLIGTAAQ